jgi:hypothetical protein
MGIVRSIEESSPASIGGIGGNHLKIGKEDSMEDSEVKTQVAVVEKAEVQPVTPTEPTVAPTVEPTVASQEPKETAGKEVSTGVQKRIDQVTSKYYAALDEKKQLAAKAQKLEEELATLKSAPAKEVSMFESEEPEGNAELAKLQKVVDELQKDRVALTQKQRYDSFADFVGEMREKYTGVSDEEAIHIVEELNKDDVPPEAHGAIEKYFAAHEAGTLKVRLQDKETKIERKQAVTEGKSIPADEHFPDDTIEAVALLKKDPAKYEELAKKAGLRG